MTDVYVLSSTPDAPAHRTLAQAGPVVSGVLLPHDGRSFTDVSGAPELWSVLRSVRDLVEAGVPLLGWGSGSALLGRVLGATLRTSPTRATSVDAAFPVPSGAELWRETPSLPRDATIHVGDADAPVLWEVGHGVGYAGTALPAPLLAWFVETRARPVDRSRRSLVARLGGRDRLRRTLATFYAHARADDLLGPIFDRTVDDWPTHLDGVTSFWETMLDGTPAYRGDFRAAHRGLGIGADHVERWLDLFGRACEAELGREGDELAHRARVMARRLGPRRPG